MTPVRISRPVPARVRRACVADRHAGDVRDRVQRSGLAVERDAEIAGARRRRCRHRRKRAGLRRHGQDASQVGLREGRQRNSMTDTPSAASASAPSASGCARRSSSATPSAWASFCCPPRSRKYGFNAIAGWVVTLIGFLFIARVLAGLARAFPHDDGPYGYTQRAFGDGTAFMVMWCYWVATWVTNAAIAIGVVGYLTILVPAVGDRFMASAAHRAVARVAVRRDQPARRARRSAEPRSSPRP